MSTQPTFAPGPTSSVLVGDGTQTSEEAVRPGGSSFAQLISRAGAPEKAVPVSLVLSAAKDPSVEISGMPDDLSRATAEALLEALKHSSTRQRAEAEINRRLPQNQANRAFFWLVYGQGAKDQEIGGKAYKTLRRLATNFLCRYHRPLTKTELNGKIRADWDDLIHHTLFGSKTVAGAVEECLPLTPEKLFENALRNRYSGILTRMKYRHIDQLRRDRREHPNSSEAETFYSEEAERGESTAHLDETRDAGYGDSDRAEEMPDPRFGFPGLGAGKDAESVFQEPFAIVEWAGKYQHVIVREAGEMAGRAWNLITEALKTGALDLHEPGDTRRALLSLISDTDGISKRDAARMLAQLSKSQTLLRVLREENRLSKRYVPPPPSVVRVGRRQRKKISSDLFTTPDRRCTSSHPAAE